jgi:hypothetical protein
MVAMGATSLANLWVQAMPPSEKPRGERDV